MLPIVLTLVVGGAAALAARVLTRPDRFRVERSLLVDAPAEPIYALIEDFHAWRRWSPFEELDPNLTRTYKGPPRGLGAVYEWSGNRKAGEGRMEITEALPPNRLTIDLEFLKPFESRTVTEFTIDPRETGTEVTWAMHGPNTLASKIMQSFVSMDRMAGGDFEKGLAKLKGIVENGE